MLNHSSLVIGKSYLNAYYLSKIINIPPEIKESFLFLEEDRYISGPHHYRSRAYSAADYTSTKFYWPSSKKFLFHQEEKYNKYLGGVSREYPAISSDVTSFTQDILKTYILSYLPASHYKIGVHQIRVISTQGMLGYPAPEGIHQDGFDFVCIILIARHNIEGGITTLHLPFPTGYLEVFKSALNVGEFLLFNDRTLFHYTSPIKSLLSCDECYRDVLVITFQKVTSNKE